MPNPMASPLISSADSTGSERASGPPPAVEAESSRVGLGLLLVALVLGLLRFARLGEWSLWFDEVLTWGDSHDFPDGLVNRAGYWLVRQSVEWAGGEPTEFSLRLLPAVAGYLAIPLAFWAFRPLAGSTRSGMAALLLAVSAWELQWSQTARFYTFVQLTSLAGAGLTIRGLLAGRWPVVTAGVLVAASGVFFHLQGALVAAALLGAAAVSPPLHGGEQRVFGRAAAITVLLPALVGVPWVYGAWSRYQETKAVADPLGSMVHFALSTGWYVTPALGAAALAAVLLLLREGDARGRLVLVVVLLGAGALVGLSAAATVSAQYLFSFFPFIALLAAWPLGSLEVGGRPVLGGAIVVALALPQLAGSALYLTSERGQRPRWRDAAEFVAANRQEGEAVLSDPAAVVEFYLGDRDPRRVRKSEDVVLFDAYNPWFVRREVKSGKSVWLVLRNDNLMTYEPALRARFKAYVQEHFRLLKQFPVHVTGRDLSVDVWYHK